MTLSPSGRLLAEPEEQAEPKLSQAAAARLTEAFADSTARGLELLAGEFLRQPLPPTFVFWRGLAQRYFTALCHQPNLEKPSELAIPKPSDWNVAVEQRRAQAAKEMAKRAKGGQAVSPVVLQGKKIATTFWGKAWCDNLEAYSDFANRLPSGRTYVRNGSVVNLQIRPGKVVAHVSGSDYDVEIQIKPLARNLWKTLQSDCTGKIDSLIELLQGRLSDGVMQVVTRADRGLFPSPKEITMKCSCPDWAGMCKHVAASLYGVGARLDEKPDLVFILRGVDPEELISKASATEAVRQTASATTLAIAESDLAGVFGIELESRPATASAKQRKKPAKSPAKSKPSGRAKAQTSWTVGKPAQSR